MNSVRGLLAIRERKERKKVYTERGRERLSNAVCEAVELRRSDSRGREKRKRKEEEEVLVGRESCHRARSLTSTAAHGCVVGLGARLLTLSVHVVEDGLVFRLACGSNSTGFDGVVQTLHREDCGLLGGSDSNDGGVVLSRCAQKALATNTIAQRNGVLLEELADRAGIKRAGLKLRDSGVEPADRCLKALVAHGVLLSKAFCVCALDLRKQRNKGNANETENTTRVCEQSDCERG